MTADFRLVVNAAQRDTYQFPSGCPGNAHGNTGFSGARRSYQAKHAAANVRGEAAHRQILQDPFFDFFQAIVVLIQHFPCKSKILNLFRGYSPWKIQTDIKIAAQHCRFGRAEGLFAQTAEFLFQFFPHFFRAAQISDSFGILRKVIHLVLFTEFSLNSPQFLPQEIFPLILHHLFLRLRRQFLFNLQNLDFFAQKPVQHHETAAGVVALQNLLFVFGTKLSILRDKPGYILITRI